MPLNPQAQTSLSTYVLERRQICSPWPVCVFSAKFSSRTSVNISGVWRRKKSLFLVLHSSVTGHRQFADSECLSFICGHLCRLIAEN